MKKMGMYCKAYHLGELRAYPAWSEKAENARKLDTEGYDLAHPRVLTDESIVYLQHSFIVTDDIHSEEYILFDDVTPEWINYCRNVIGFTIPKDVAAIADEKDKA